jgi:transposase
MLVAEEAVEIRVLSKQGKSIRDIARLLKVSRNTVRRYVRGEGLPRYERKARPSKLDDYKQYIAERVRTAAPEWIPAGPPPCRYRSKRLVFAGWKEGQADEAGTV